MAHCNKQKKLLQVDSTSIKESEAIGNLTLDLTQQIARRKSESQCKTDESTSQESHQEVKSALHPLKVC